MAKLSDLKWNYRIFMQTYRYRQYDCGLSAGRTIGGPDKSGTEVAEPDGPPENDPVRAGLVSDGFALVEFHCLASCR